jgi:hypothetical protein
MRYLLLLCTYLTIASELCKIDSLTSFENHQRSDLTVYLTNTHNNIYDHEVGTLFSLFFVKQLDYARPNSSIDHTLIIKSTKTPEVYTIKQHIRLKGCKIHSISIDSDDAEAEYDFNRTHAYISYKLIKKVEEESPKDSPFKLIK